MFKTEVNVIIPVTLRKLAVLAVVALFIFSSLPDLVRASGGMLDPTFDGDGKVTTDFSNGTDLARGVALQPDGKIIAAGSTNSDFALARYNSDGSLDSNFGSGGRVTTDFFGKQDAGNALALQPDGKIVVAGSSNRDNELSDFALARYNSDGTPDASFGQGGKTTSVFAGSNALELVIQPDGKLIAAGAPVFSIARFNSDGTLDTSFGSGGKVTANNRSLAALALQSDGKILAGGGTLDDAPDTDFIVSRYNSNGSLDTAFGSNGVVILDFIGGPDFARAIAVQPDSKIVVAGQAAADVSLNTNFAVARLTPNGGLDSTFGQGGKTTTDFAGEFDIAWAIVIQPDGKIVVAGDAFAPISGWDFALARYDGGASFDICIQDDGSGNKLQFNSLTGDYEFTNCAGLTLGGKGSVTRTGSTITLQHNASDRRVLAKIDSAVNRANATIQILSQGRTFSIMDRDARNNTCACR